VQVAKLLAALRRIALDLAVEENGKRHMGS
jgi:hypothetical protein